MLQQFVLIIYQKIIIIHFVLFCFVFSSDGIARVFTASEERFASEEELKVSLFTVSCFLFRFFC